MAVVRCVTVAICFAVVVPAPALSAQELVDALISDESLVSLVEFNAVPEFSGDPRIRPVTFRFSDVVADELPTIIDTGDTVVQVFAGLDGSKQPQDFGVNAHFGGRVQINVGTALNEASGLGVQFGAGMNQSDHAVAVTGALTNRSAREQVFLTGGLFQRSDDLVWSVGYDFLTQDDYDDFEMSQLRGLIGIQVTSRDQIGVFGMLPLTEDRGTWGAVPVTLSPIGQASLYWRRTWDSLAELTVWVGVAEGHGEDNVALGPRPALDERLVYGADLHVPLSKNWALYGEANFITPSDTGTVDAVLGVMYYFGGSAPAGRRQRFRPVLGVANNTSFSVDLAR